MINIEIFQQKNTTEDEPSIEKIIKIEEIEPSLIDPVNMKVGIPIPMTELVALISQIKPIEQPQQTEPEDSYPDESYYARDIPIYEDRALLKKKINLPHHIGLRLVLQSLHEKYGATDNLLIRIS